MMLERGEVGHSRNTREQEDSLMEYGDSLKDCIQRLDRDVNPSRNGVNTRRSPYDATWSFKGDLHESLMECSDCPRECCRSLNGIRNPLRGMYDA